MQPVDPQTKVREVKRAVGLRPFPYPFAAALALASDIDRCDPGTFIRIHQYLNCPRHGLGLPVSDSFFGVGRQCGHMSYYADDGKTRTPEAELIRCSLEHGLIDTLHSWGAFDRKPPEAAFIRRVAEGLTDELCRLGLPVPILSIHGAPINYHNLYVRTEPNFRGDDPDSPFYTGDLVARLGVHYYWASELLPWPLSITGSAQGRRLKFWRIFQNAIKNSAKRCLGKPYLVRPAQQVLHLTYPLKLRDGRIVLGFSRFNSHPEGLWGQPTRHTLRYSLSTCNLEWLIREKGYWIVYTHLGMPADPTAPLFPAADQRALEILADYYRSGRIWVARTIDLLNYWRAFHFLDWTIALQDDELIIRLLSLADPVTGKRQPLLKELAGICFYTPRPHRTRLCLEDKILPTHVYPPDETGQMSVGLAVPEKPDITFLQNFSHMKGNKP